MSKDLTTSRIDRQNILNNELAVAEIQRTSKIVVLLFEDKLYLTKEMVSVSLRLIQGQLTDVFHLFLMN